MLLLISNEKRESFKYERYSLLFNMAKHQICITIDEETLLKAKERLRDGVFRNKSHFFEFAAKKLLEEKND